MFYARLMRAEVVVQKQLDYVAAARGLGYGWARILFRHILPNAMRPILVYWVTDLALEILLGSSLGYLGLGAQPPTAEWGVLIADGKNFFTHSLVDDVLSRRRDRARGPRLQPGRRRARRSSERRAMSAAPILAVRNLEVVFSTPRGPLHAVDRVDLACGRAKSSAWSASPAPARA